MYPPDTKEFEISSVCIIHHSVHYQLHRDIQNNDDTRINVLQGVTMCRR